MVEAKIMPEFEELPPIEEKAKKARKERTVKKPEPTPLFDSAMLLPFVRFVPNRLAAHYQNERFSLTKEEETALVDGLNKVTSKWLPSWFDKFSDEVALLTYIALIAYPRYELAKSLNTLKNE